MVFDILSDVWESLTVFNAFISLLCFYFLIRLFSSRGKTPQVATQQQEEEKPRMPPRDFTNEELLEFNGSDPEKPICLAVRGKVFDVTRGKDFYGPGGVYGVFAGHDATRGLANWSTDESDIKDTYDNCSDLTPVQWMEVRDWEGHFMSKYDYVGKLLTPEQAAERTTDDASLKERKELFDKVQSLVKQADEEAMKQLENETKPKDKDT